MKDRIITIFGGAGFVGRSLVQRLAKEGAFLRVVVTNPDQANFLKTMGDPGQIKLFVIDFKDQRQVDAVCKDAWGVVNLIGILYEKGRKTFDYAHVTIAEMIARSCKNNNVENFIHISAIGADPASDSDYLSTKGLGEQHVRQAFPNVTVLRPSIIFGANDQFINFYAQLVVLSPFIPFFGNANTKLQPVYVGDVADAIVKVLMSSKAHGQIFELGGPEIYTFSSFADLILKSTKRQRPKISLPYIMGKIMGALLQFLPRPPLTPDQVRMLKKDNIVYGHAKTFKDLGITPTSLDSILPTYLERFKPRF